MPLVASPEAQSPKFCVAISQQSRGPLLCALSFLLNEIIVLQGAIDKLQWSCTMQVHKFQCSMQVTRFNLLFLLLVSIQLEMFRLQMVRIIEHNIVFQVPSTCKLQAMAFQNSISMGFLFLSYFSNCMCVVVLSFISLNSISLICNIDDSITTTQFPVQILFLQGWALAFQFLIQVHLCVF